MAINEDTFRTLITNVVGSDAGDEAIEILLEDVLQFTQWYGVEDSFEPQFESGESLVDLIGKDNKRVLLAKDVRYYVTQHLPSNGNIGQATLEVMDRIVNWRSWLPAWIDDQYSIYHNQEKQAYEDAYYGLDGYGDETGFGEYDDFGI